MAHPPLTDRPALLRARARALRSPEPALFLQDEAVAEVQERLELVNRAFTSASVVTGFPALWQTALPQARVVEDAEVLDLAPATQDLVVHALALHWADDPLGQIIQCRRALRPDGLFIGLIFGGRTLHELRSALAEAEAEVSGGLSPRVVPMGDIRDLGALVQRAGLALPVADSFTRIVQYRDLFHLAADLRAMGETNALAARLRRPTRRAVFLRAAEILARSFPAKDGRITATFEIVCLTGWAPHESQQQPLRPGSAAQRLADALNVTERPLPRTSQDG